MIASNPLIPILLGPITDEEMGTQLQQVQKSAGPLEQDRQNSDLPIGR